MSDHSRWHNSVHLKLCLLLVRSVVQGNALILQAAIKAIYKSGTLCPVVTQRCDTITPASWATFYNLEMVVALAFRLNTYEASRIRQKVLENLYLQKENGNSLFIWLVEKYMGN